MNSFSAKRLRVTLILANTNQSFPGTNANTLILTDMRVSAKVQAVARQSTQADIQIFGMTRDNMNAASVIWAEPPIVSNHLVMLEANDTENDNGWTQVFKGTIIEAQPDYRNAPAVSFSLLAMTGYSVKITPAQSTSYPESTDITAAAQDIVAAMGAPWTFVDGGASGVISNPYFSGSLFDQLQQACDAAKADFYLQGDEILVTERGLPRSDIPAVVLSPASGLVGYPMFERSGLNVQAIFNPAFTCGTALEIESSVISANGRWYPYSLQHFLEAKMPHGSWLSQLQCLRVITQ